MIDILCHRVTLTLLLLVISSYMATAQIIYSNPINSKNVKYGVEKISYHEVCLVVGEIIPQFNNRKEQLIANTLTEMFILSFLNQAFDWIDVTNKEADCQSNKFAYTSGSVSDFGGYVKIQLEINANDTIEIKTFQIKNDSLLVGIDKMAKSIAKHISAPIQETSEKLKIFYRNVVIKDESLNKYKPIVNSTFEYLLEDYSLTVFKESENDLESQADLAVIPEIAPSDSNNMVNLNLKLRETQTGNIIYVVDNSFEAENMLAELENAMKDLDPFLKSYGEIKDNLSTENVPKRITKLVRKEIGDLDKEPNYQNLIARIKRALYIDPNYIPAQVTLGKLYYLNLQNREAFQVLNKALESDSDDIETMHILAQVYSADYKDSISYAYLQKAEKLIGNRTEKKLAANVYQDLAIIDLNYLEYETAIANLEKALSYNPDDKQIWWDLGNAHYQKFYYTASGIDDSTDIMMAIDQFKKAKRIFPDDSSFARNQANLLNIWAITIFDSVEVMLDWTNLDHTNPRIRLYLNKSKQKFLQSVMIDQYDVKINSTSYNYLAYIEYFIEKNYEKGIDYSTQSVSLLPNDEWSYRLFAVINSESNKSLPEAKQAILKAIAINNKVAGSYITLGEIYAKLNQPDSAFLAYEQYFNLTEEIYREDLEDYLVVSNEVKAFQPGKEKINDFLAQDLSEEDSMWAVMQLAEIAYKEADYDNAQKLINSVLDIEPRNKQAFALIDSLFYDKNYEPAMRKKIEMLEKTFDDQNLNDYWYLAWAYSDLKNYDKALSISNEALTMDESLKIQGSFNYLKGRVYYYITEALFNRGDTVQSLEYAQKAIDFSLLSNQQDSTQDEALTIVLVIYNDYLYDFQRAFKINEKIMSIDREKLTNRTNYIDAAFNNGYYELCLKEADSVFFDSDNGKYNLTTEDRLQLRFFVFACNVAINEYIEANIQFGRFLTNYRERPDSLKNLTYLWRGVRKQLSQNKDFNFDYRKILLNMINALEEKNKQKGLKILAAVEDRFKELQAKMVR